MEAGLALVMQFKAVSVKMEVQNIPEGRTVVACLLYTSDKDTAALRLFPLTV